MQVEDIPAHQALSAMDTDSSRPGLPDDLVDDVHDEVTVCGASWLNVECVLNALTAEQALALAVAKGALNEERQPFVTDSADPRYVSMRRYVSRWETASLSVTAMRYGDAVLVHNDDTHLVTVEGTDGHQLATVRLGADSLDPWGAGRRAADAILGQPRVAIAVPHVTAEPVGASRDMRYIAAANPQRILELLRELEAEREHADGLAEYVIAVTDHGVGCGCWQCNLVAAHRARREEQT